MRFNAFPVQKRIMWPLICLIDPHQTHKPHKEQLLNVCHTPAKAKTRLIVR